MIQVFFIDDQHTPLFDQELPVVPATGAPVILDGRIYFVVLVEWHFDSSRPELVYVQVMLGRREVRS